MEVSFAGFSTMNDIKSYCSTEHCIPIDLGELGVGREIEEWDV